MYKPLSNLVENRYQEIIQKLKDVADRKTDLHTLGFWNDLEEVLEYLENLWTFLENSESLLIELIHNKQPDSDSEQGSMEYGGVLYLVNHYLSKTDISIFKDLYNLFKLLGMPDTKMTPEEITALENEAFDGSGIVAGDGTLYSNIPFAQLDPNWTLAFVTYLYYLVFKNEKANFNETPLTPTNQDENPVFSSTIKRKDTLSFAIFGDWGTGPWKDGDETASNTMSPSQLVAKGLQQFDYDIAMHLGDVYYTGLEIEESLNLIPDFPKGKLLNFTLNSNHEAYDGSNGYFKKALTNPMFAIQKNTSYFAFTFKDWLIIGLDSAFYDESFFVMQGGINQKQIDFIQGLQPTTGQKILLFTHHTALNTNGKKVNNEKKSDNLYVTVYEAFNKKGPHYWYYGHMHNAIVYNDNAATSQMPIGNEEFSRLRCVGSASIPFGKGYELSNPDGSMVDSVSYFAKTKMPDANNRQTNRVLNGFAIITLSEGKLEEIYYEVEKSGTGVQVNNVFSL